MTIPSAGPREIARVCSILAAGRVLVLTGAGISAESGVPVFRGPEGVWKRHRPEELATPAAFARDPRLVWEWYAWRRETVGGCRPNAAHRALARWQRGRPGRRVVTQNVDGLHLLALAPKGAGLDRLDPEDRPLELHGSLFRTRCTGCDLRRPDRSTIDATDESTLPRCGECGALLRPDVVWFGEPLDGRALETALGLAESAEAVLVVGTSGVVQPAASIATAATRSGAPLVEVNPESTPLTPHATVSLRAGAAATLPEILDTPS